VHQNSKGLKPALDGASRAPGSSGPASPEDQTFTSAVTRVRQLIANTRHKAALEQAKDVHKTYRCTASEALLIDAYAGRIQDLIRQNLTVEANALLDLVRERYPAATGRLAGLTASAAARAGNLEQLVGPLNDPSLPAERRDAIELAVQEQVTSLAALAECPALPSDHPLRQAAVALQKAFEAVTSGPVPDEMLTLGEVSRRSPLAPWKMLVCAIAYFYRRDDEACRRYLDAVKPESAAARLVPAIRSMVDGKSGGQVQAATAELVSQVTGDVPALKHAIEALDRAFESAEHDSCILDAIRAAAQACRRNAPGQLERLKQHISVRAALDELDTEKTRGAMGGPSRHDAYFYRLFARGMERQSGHPSDLFLACARWNDFRLKAVDEGWFAPNGAAVATLYLHMAELLRDIPQNMIRSFEQSARGPNGQMIEDLFFVRPQNLYERACVLDPHSEAFSRWLEWANKKQGTDAERVAEAWHKILPQDIEPILYLMAAFEERGSFPTALQYLVKAERIDGVNPEVRRARLRLLAGNAIRCIQRKKPGLAEQSLKEICALPQVQQGDRLAFAAALGYLTAALQQDFAQAQMRRSEIERLLESRAAASLLIFAVAIAAKRTELGGLEPVQKLAKNERAALPATLARLTALAKDVQFSLRIPPSWLAETVRQFRRTHQKLDVNQLHTLGEAALEANESEFAYAVSAAGLERGGATDAQFLFLRARSLPQSNFERRMICAAAAARLARQHDRHDLAAKAVDLLRGPFKDGSIELTPEQLADVLRQEKKEPVYPKGGRQGPRYRSIIGARLCPCPDCRRERGEMIDEFDEFEDDEDDDFDEDDPLGGLDIPEDMPPEIAKVLLEETARAVLNGETLEQFIARLTGEGPPPEAASRKSKSRRK
jgi:hypothetical protein